MGEVAKIESMPVPVNESAAVLSMIERLALDPNVKIETVEKMIDLQERILKRNAEQAFASDFAAMQCELPRIARNGQIDIKKDGRLIQSTKFAKLEDINDGIRPTLQKYGFGVSFSIEQAQGSITVTAKLLHKLGHSEKTSITLPIDNSGSKNSVQGNGSTVSYGKRYAMSALLNISTGDDLDGAEPESKRLLSDDQIDSLRLALDAAGMTEAQFCGHKKINVASLDEFQPQRLKGALAFLQSIAQGAAP